MKIFNPVIKNISGFFIAAIAWYALGLQLYIMLKNATASGISSSASIINFFSYFTILSNLLVASSLSCSILFSKSLIGSFFEKTTTQSAIAVYIIIVGLVYSLALRKIWNPEGLQLVADRLLHDLIPVLYLIYWIAFIPKKSLRWKNIFPWLTFPAAYLTYSLIRGEATNWYPYYFINADQLGYARVFVNALMVLAAFIVVGLILIFLNRLIGKER